MISNLYNRITKLCINHDELINNRAKLDTGTFCNYKCSFCYYKDRLKEKTDFNTIKKRIDYLIECGITQVDLSGGESSIHEDWFSILDYCNKNGLYISTLSNGFMFISKRFMEISKNKGLKEILFSLHGYDNESHNSIVGKDDAFERIIKSIQNANELGLLVRINCTVTNDNYKHLDKFVSLVKQYKIFEINFLTLNYWGSASKSNVINYNEVTPYIQNAIDLLKDFCIINVRYTPYCFMIGYEKYVCNYYQHIYDIYDWNIALYSYTLDPRMYKENRLTQLYQAANKNRLYSYYKTKECFNCKYFNICDGIEKQITEINLHPVPGKKITDVLFFRKKYYEQI